MVSALDAYGDVGRSKQARAVLWIGRQMHLIPLPTFSMITIRIHSERYCHTSYCGGKRYQK